MRPRSINCIVEVIVCIALVLLSSYLWLVLSSGNLSSVCRSGVVIFRHHCSNCIIISVRRTTSVGGMHMRRPQGSDSHVSEQKMLTPLDVWGWTSGWACESAPILLWRFSANFTHVPALQGRPQDSEDLLEPGGARFQVGLEVTDCLSVCVFLLIDFRLSLDLQEKSLGDLQNSNARQFRKSGGE